MRVLRLYYPKELKINMTISLDSRNCHYLLNVLRVKVGQKIILFNGDGSNYKAQILHIRKKNIEVVIQSRNEAFTESPLFVEIGQGIAHSSKMDYVLQKAIELGVKRITPLITNRSVKVGQRFSHWERVVISACEQSGRVNLPEIREPQYLSDWISKKRDGVSFVCDLKGQRTLYNFKKHVEQVTVLIGPEGGLGEHEVEQAVKNDFIRLYLGPRVLRTETATVAVLSLLQGHFGDLKSPPLN